MTEKNLPTEGTRNLIHPFLQPSNLGKVFLAILIISITLGGLTGYILADKQSSQAKSTTTDKKVIKTAQEDTKTFRDFTEGTLKPRPSPKNPNEYIEGTHLLEREGAPPVALTSSVVDLTKFEGKKVKVFGETQKAIKEGWLMDVGKVEEK